MFLRAKLGGDFYDFLPYGEGRLGLALVTSPAKGRLRRFMARSPSYASRTYRRATWIPTDASAITNPSASARLEARFIALTFSVYDASDDR